MTRPSFARRPRPLTADPIVQARLPNQWRVRRPPPPDLALVLELIARELRGGASLVSALAALPTDVDLGLHDLRRRVDDGAAIGDELDRWGAAIPGDDGVLVRAVLRLGLSTGAALADALDRTAAVLRERGQLADELRALSAQSRASATMIAAAPLGFLLVFALADPGALSFLLASPLGWICLLVGVALDSIGFWWMRRLVAAVDR